MLISLADLRHVAPSVGFPADRKRLKEQLRRAGVLAQIGRVSRNQVGNVYKLADLPDVFQEELRKRSAGSAQSTEPASPKFKAGRYMGAAPSLQKQADRRHNGVWQMRRALHGGATMSAAAALAADEYGGHASRWKAHWRSVRDRPEDEWLDTLVPAHKGRARAEIDERMWMAFVADFGRVEKPTAEACYGRLLRLSERQGWGTVPTLKTLQRRWEDLPADVKRLMREGERSLLDSLPHQERDRTGDRPLDSWNMDSRRWDVFVRLDDGRIVRPVVTVAQDEATNFIVAYEVTETETAASYRRVLCAGFTRYGLPGKVRFDNTLAAANKKLTAGASWRFRFTDRLDDVEGLLPRLGVKVAFAKPGNGRAKLVERAFADLKERTEKDPRLAGAYTGRSPVEKPANYGSRAVPFALFCQVLAEGIAEYNSRTGRRSLIGSCYQAAFLDGLRDIPVRRLTDAQRRMFFLAAERLAVSPAGTITIKHKGERRGHRYGFVDGNDALREHAGQDVVVRFDENDLSAPVMIEALDGRLISADVPRITAGAFNDVEAAAAHGRARMEVLRAAKRQRAAFDRMDAIESGEAGRLVSAPEPSLPAEARVVKGEFRKRPRPAEPDAGFTAEEIARGDRATRILQDDDDLDDEFPSFGRHVA